MPKPRSKPPPFTVQAASDQPTPSQVSAQSRPVTQRVKPRTVQTPALPSPTPGPVINTASRPPDPAWWAHLKNPRPNPNRRTFLAAGGLEAQYLYNPYDRELNAEQIRELEFKGVDQVVIVINVNTQPDTRSRKSGFPPEYLIGVSIKQKHRVVYLTYPVQGDLEPALALALELAVLRSPGMANLRLVTSHKFLWDGGNYTELTRQRLMDYGSRIKLNYPIPHDLGNVLSRLAADGITGPKTVDYHIYTSSVSNGERCFTATLLWGHRRANFFIQTLHTPDLTLAHTQAAEWAFGMVPAESHLFLINDCKALNTIWQTAEIEGTELKQTVKPLIERLGEKKLSFASGGERYHAALCATVRQMAGDLHTRAAPDIRPEFLTRPARQP